MKKPCNVIQIDKYTKKIQMPDLLLMTRSFDIIGKIPYYTDWKMSLVGNGIDEIIFTVNKYVNGNICPVWDDLIDLKIIDVRGFGKFEISVDYTDYTQTIKSVHGVSLEAELAQIPLYEFHVNDDDALEYMTEKDTDKNGNFIPTVFYDPDDEAHSLLHRVLADKAPHWHIGYVTPYIALSEEDQPEDVKTFQRTYTCDGTTIYDFLTGEVAKESNVIFTFDTINRRIDCYSLCDCIDQETGDVQAKGIGEDTLVFISKDKLANEITISSNKDNVKNCFRIEGGDDVITDMVRAVNMNGSNYIYQFADFQYNDMPEALVKAIKKYNEDLSKEADTYYGENGIYTRLCKAYEDLAYYESVMMPDVSIKETTAEEQYNIMKDALTDKNMTVGVSSLGNYNNNLFVGVSNNIEAMANVLIDARYKAEVIKETTSYNDDDKDNIYWTGNIRITRAADETDYYPKTDKQINTYFTVKIDDDELTFTRQKIEKALHKGSMLDIDFEVAKMDDEGIREYFNLYSLNRLKSFYDGYNSCLSILMQLDADSSVRNDMYEKYYNRMRILSNPPTEENPKPVPGVLDIRQQQVNDIKDRITDITAEQEAFQKDWDFRDYLEKAGKDFYEIFCSYRREDTYKNDNYISDGLSTSECLAKAKELVEAATAEAKKACVLQRTVSTSLNNLFALPEFESLYEKFALFNYIRIRTEDEILKLRLIGVEFSGDSVNEIYVTFSEQIESIDGKLSDLQSIIQQAKSMATSYPSTALQAKKGEKAQSTVEDMFTYGLNAAKAMLTNNDSNEVTINQSGIICKRMDDEGYYGDKQLRLTGNMLVFTRDAWKTVELAIGESKYYNPVTNEYEIGYGVKAHSIFGNLMAGNELFIGNTSGNVLITGDGINVTNGYFNISNGKNTICIDPDNNEKLFSINNGNEDCLYTDSEGNLNVKGKIYATSGEFTGDIKSGTTIKCSDNFIVDENGKVTAKDIDITGGKIQIEKNEEHWEDHVGVIDTHTLNLDHKGLYYSLESDVTSYNVKLEAQGLTFNGKRIIDNPGQTVPSIGNIGDVTTFDGISLRSVNSKIDSVKQETNSKIDNITQGLSTKLTTDGNISNISWRTFDGVSYLVLEVGNTLVLFKPDSYLNQIVT